MSTVRRKTPTDEAFYLWINGYPDSYHPLDMERFYKFVKTALRYKKKYFDREYFEKECRYYKPYMSNEIIEDYYNKMRVLSDFYKTPRKDAFGFRNDGRNGLIMTAIVDHKYYEIPVDMKEHQKGLDNKEIVRRFNEKNER